VRPAKAAGPVSVRLKADRRKTPRPAGSKASR